MKLALLLAALAAASLLVSCKKPDNAGTKGPPSSATDSKTARPASATVQAARKVLAEAGFPTTLEALNAAYAEPPAGQNAATAYIAAIKKLVTAPTNTPYLPLVTPARLSLPPPQTPMAPAMKQAIAAHLARNRAALEGFRQATNFAACRFPLDLRNGFNTQLPHLSGLRGGDRLLQLEVALQAENGQTAPAAASLLTLLKIPAALSTEPPLVSQLVRHAQLNAAARALERLLCRRPVAVAQLASLTAAFTEAETRDTMPLAMATELVMLAEGMDRNPAKLAADLSKEAGKAVDPDSMLKDHIRCLPIARLPYPQRLTDLGKIQSELSADDADMLRKWFLKHAQSIAHLRLARAALAIERHRAGSRSPVPASLDELPADVGVEVLADPFDGQPIRYRRLSSGYQLYSIGPDRKDDGGKLVPADETNVDAPGDIGFVVTR